MSKIAVVQLPDDNTPTQGEFKNLYGFWKPPVVRFLFTGKRAMTNIMEPEELQKLKERINYRLGLDYLKDQVEKRKLRQDDISRYLPIDRKLYEDFVKNLKNKF